MTPNEVKAWFRGFCTKSQDPPSLAQWKQIIEMIETMGVSRLAWQESRPSERVSPLPPVATASCAAVKQYEENQ